jgi:putative ABC transport system permease protein
MFRVAFKDLMARKRRLFTTGLAVMLGIAFLTGTQLLSGALSDSIDDLIGDVYEGIDAVVRSPDTQETPFGQPIRTPVPAALADDVASVDGVRTAEGFVETTGPQLSTRTARCSAADSDRRRWSTTGSRTTPSAPA